MALYRAIKGQERVIGVALVSRIVTFEMLPSDVVFAHKLGIFASSQFSFFGLLQSNLHVEWAWHYCSTMRDAGINYSPSDCFETFPFPLVSLACLDGVAERYHEQRCQIMQTRQQGLTKTYNHFHDRGEQSADIARLRALHVEMDQAVAAAYGWSDLRLDHDFRGSGRDTRFTVSDPIRQELLDRLLELNHKRHQAESQTVTQSSVQRNLFS